MADLLFLTQRIPYPPIKGDRIRALQILKYLRQSHEIYLGCLVDDPLDWEHVDTVRALCKESHFAGLDRRRAKIRCLGGLLSGNALSVEYFRDRGLARWVDQVVERVRPATIFVYSSNMAPYVLGHVDQGTVRVVDLVDVDSEKWREYADAARGPMQWLYRREWRRIAALEHRIARECDFSTFVSDAEAALFARLAPDCATKIRAISNGVDHAYFDPAGDYPAPYDAAKPIFVFTGTMDYPPNVDAVVWFANDIFPAIRGRRAASQFYIVGANPTAAVKGLSRQEGVHVTGRVADVRPYLAHAAAAVAPMRIARGIQNKVLEAMAMAKPAIVTPAALAGIAATAGREVVVAADAAAFAAAADRLATGTEGREIGAAARTRILADYSWARRLRGFDPLLSGSLR